MTDRQKKTPEERALEALGTAERVRTKAQAKVADLRVQLADALNVVRLTTARLEYVAIHPDLPQEERDRVAAYLHPSPENPDADA